MNDRDVVVKDAEIEIVGIAEVADIEIDIVRWRVAWLTASLRI